MTSLFSRWFQPPWAMRLGHVWQNTEAQHAFEAGKIKSLEESSDVITLAFRNCTSNPLVLCWVDVEGDLHHFYKLEPSFSTDKSNIVLPSDHVEESSTEHAFLICKQTQDDPQVKKWDPKDIIGGYRPTKANGKLHLVTIANTKSLDCFCSDTQTQYNISVQEGQQQHVVHDDMLVDCESLGDVFVSAQGDAREAFQSGELRSEDAGARVRLAFRNLTPTPLVVCWISASGKAHHFRNLLPCREEPTTSQIITQQDMIEHSFCNHAFTISLPTNENATTKQQEEEETASTASSSTSSNENSSDSVSSVSSGSTNGARQVLDPASIVGGYRPRKLGQLDSNDDDDDNGDDSEDDDDDDEFLMQLVTIKQVRRKRRSFVSMLRSEKVEYDYQVYVTLAHCDPTPVDSTSKVYECTTLGGWPVRIEPDLLNKEHSADWKSRFELDLKEASRILPKHATEFLKKTTPIYINKSLKYGPVVCPVRGEGMCFHPGTGWLVENGMSPEKCKAVELYDALNYTDDCDNWGPGGVLVHEFSHAYHDLCVKDGYDNKEIRECYEQAMAEGLYECVQVHGHDKETAKAYACTNEFEYFAELSTAYLGGLSKKEFNKWFPFNRQQLKKHDPRAYKLLERLWKERT